MFAMSERNQEKLKELLSSVPPGGMVDSRWFNRHQIARPTVHGYVKQGWLEHLAHGVYLRPLRALDPKQPLDWEAVAASMSVVMQIPFHVGGMNALNLHGHAHYLQMSGPDRVAIYADKLPSWLSKLNTTAHFERRNPTLFADPRLGVEPLQNSGRTFGENDSFPVSTPERAVLEALDELPNGAGFEQLDMVFEGLATLRPRKLMELLHNCRKIKVLRLFFVFADKHNHAWFKHLDKDALDFGSGDRQLVKRGKIHPTYRITVPESLANPHGETGRA